MDYTFDYLVIGGGMAGLHISKLLAKKYPEKSICIVEKYDYWGGRVYTHTPIEKPKLHFEAGAGRIADYHKRVGEYVKEYKLTKIYIKADHNEFRRVNPDGSVDVTENGFSEIIQRMLKDLPPTIKDNLYCMTIREACERAYGKIIVDQVFSEFGYRSETEVIRADLAINTFNGFMGEKNNYYVIAEGFSEIPRRLAKDVLEMGVRLMTTIEVTGLERHDGNWLVKGFCSKKPWQAKTKNVIFALNRDALSELDIFKDSWLVKSVKMEPLYRIYAQFPLDSKGKAWFHDIPHTTTNDPIRYFIPVNSAEGVAMISYTDAQDTEVWHSIKDPKVREAKIMQHIRRLFPEKTIPQPTLWSHHYWKHGCSYWLPFPVGPMDPWKAREEAVYPMPKKYPNVYVCGESWSCCQAWVEGAIRNADLLFDRHLSK